MKATNKLIQAVQRNQIKLVEDLLKAKINTEELDEHGQTALMYACRYKYIPIIDLLLKAKADPYTKSKDGKTVIDMMLAGGRVDRNILDVFIKNKVKFYKTKIQQKLEDISVVDGRSAWRFGYYKFL